MKIGLVAAMKCEIEGINGLLQNKIAEHSLQLHFQVGNLGNNEIVTVCSGIGLVNAALATQALIRNYSVDCLINPGVAGALSKDLNVCDIVASTDVTYWDFNPKQLMVSFPYMENASFAADAYLLKRCLEYCDGAVVPQKIIAGRIVSGQRFITDLETKNRLHAEMSADCVEMEGAAVAHACYLAKKPYLVVRSISDSLNDTGEKSSLRFREFLGQASLQLTKVLEKLISSL